MTFSEKVVSSVNNRLNTLTKKVTSSIATFIKRDYFLGFIFISFVEIEFHERCKPYLLNTTCTRRVGAHTCKS